MKTQRLLSIHKASQILGVSEATLRIWTDEGQVKAFVTPGGHRRYSESELKQFINSRQKVLGFRELAQKVASTSSVYREISQQYLKPGWYHHLSDESREHLLHLGQGLFNLIVDFIKNPSRCDEVIQAARLKGEEFGSTLAQLGLPLTDSVEVFMYNRGYTLDFMTKIMTDSIVQNKKVFESLPSVTHIMDEALLCLVSAHQKASTTSSGDKKQIRRSK